jgi:hypothetical protein
MLGTAAAAAQSSPVRRASTKIRCMAKFAKYIEAAVVRALPVKMPNLLFSKCTTIKKPKSETATVTKNYKRGDPEPKIASTNRDRGNRNKEKIVAT